MSIENTISQFEPTAGTSHLYTRYTLLYGDVCIGQASSLEEVRHKLALHERNVHIALQVGRGIRHERFDRSKVSVFGVEIRETISPVIPIDAAAIGGAA